jgi:hypothetical protein
MRKRKSQPAVENTSNTDPQKRRKSFPPEGKLVAAEALEAGLAAARATSEKKCVPKGMWYTLRVRRCTIETGSSPQEICPSTREANRRHRLRITANTVNCLRDGEPRDYPVAVGICGRFIACSILRNEWRNRHQSQQDEDACATPERKTAAVAGPVPRREGDRPVRLLSPGRLRVDAVGDPAHLALQQRVLGVLQ